jgi:hypothetical protein
MRELLNKLYSQLTAIETLGISREGPHLNARGARILRYLRARRRREK